MKQKVLKKSLFSKPAAKPLWPWFSFIFAVVLFFSPTYSAFADSTCTQTNGGKQTCDLSEITVKVDTLINGQLGNFTTAGAADGSFTFEVKVTLISPSSITFDTDSSLAASSTQITILGKQSPSGSNRLLGAGVTATPVANSAVCGTQTVSNLAYTNCSNPPFDQNKLLPSTTIQAGQVFIDQTYTVDHTQFAKLGITQQVNGSDLTTGINQFYVYANLGVGYSNPFWNTLTGAGKNILVQLYANQSQATAAAQSNQQPPACPSGQNASTSTPTCVPGYGNTTGSATNPQTVVTPSIGDKLAQFINEMIGDILALIQLVIYGVFANLIAPIIVAVLSIHPYQDTFVAVIYSGWETIRNLCNIFFIVALIIIAMATLFRVESYKARHLLVQLIIAALLINFSLVIGQAVLAVADTVQAQFLSSNITSVNNLAKQLMTTNNSAISAWFRDTSQTSTANAVNSSLFGGTFANLVWLALSTGTFMVFLAIAAFLVIRIVALWLLLMISPVAYAVAVLPSTAQYREKWWKEFLKYAFFTPIMAFFLNMTAIMASNAQTNKILQAAASSAGITSSVSFANLIVTIGSNVLLLVFLIVSLEVAKQAGIYGAEGINKIAKGGIFLPFKAAAKPFQAAGEVVKAVPGFIGKGYSRFTTGKMRDAEDKGNTGRAMLWRGAQLLNPTMLKKGWESYKHEKDMDAYDPGGGDVRDTLNHFMPTNWQWKKGLPRGLGQKTHYGRVESTNVTAHKRSELEKAPLSEEQKVEFGQGLHHAGDIAAMNYIVQDGRHEDGDMITAMEKDQMALANQLLQSHPGWTKKQAEEEAKKIMPAIYDPVEYIDLLTERLRHAGYSEGQIAREMVYLTEYAEGQTKERGLGYYLNEWDGIDRVNNDFSGYEKLDKKSNREFKDLLLKQTDGQDIFQQDSVGNLLFTPKLEDGSTVGSTTYTISDYKSFKKALDETHKDNWLDRRAEDSSGKFKAEEKLKYHGKAKADLRYVMMGARKTADAGKRLNRGSIQKWTGALEPAAEMIQSKDIGYYGVNSYATFKDARTPKAQAVKMATVRDQQGRNLFITGVKPDANGDIFVDPASPNCNIDYETFAIKLGLNPVKQNALIQNLNFSHEELEKIVNTINTRYSAYTHGRTFKLDKPTDGKNIIEA